MRLSLKNAAMDERLRVLRVQSCVDVVWRCGLDGAEHAACSLRGVREGSLALTQDQVRELLLAVSPMAYMDAFAATPKKSLVVYAPYDLTFRVEFSREVLKEFFEARGLDFVAKRLLPCGHYTTGETPYKYLDGWYLGSFVYGAFKRLAMERKI